MSDPRIDKLLSDASKKGILLRRASEITGAMTWIPTGSLTLDKAIGRGYPGGKVVELFGKHSSGKSLLSLQAEAWVTQQKKYVIHCDLEGNHSHIELNALRQRFGIDNNYVIQIDPQDAEAVINTANKLLQELGPECLLMVVDSIGALATDKELDRNAEDSGVAEVARLMSAWMRKLYVMNRHACCMFLNHEYSAISRIPLPPQTKGGNSIKYAAAVRLEVKGKKIPDLDDESKGAVKQEMLIHVKKNKVDIPERLAACVFDLRTFKFDVEEELLILAPKLGIIKLSPPWYIFDIKGKEYKFQGREKAKQFLREQPKVAEALTNAVLNGQGA